MSEFTKDELQIILLDMDTYIRQNKILKESPIHKELRLKIQSMIDNYCDHETNIMSNQERERKFKIYHEQILPKYDNDPDKVPPYLEPDFNEGWK